MLACCNLLVFLLRLDITWILYLATMRPKVLGGFKSSPICASSAAMIYSSFAVLYITNDTAAFASVTVGDAFDCVHCFSFSKKPTCHTQKVLSTIIIATLRSSVTVLTQGLYHVNNTSVTPNTQRKWNNADVSLNTTFVLKVCFTLTNVTG